MWSKAKFKPRKFFQKSLSRVSNFRSESFHVLNEMGFENSIARERETGC